jgi:hypothetical protein
MVGCFGRNAISMRARLIGAFREKPFGQKGGCLKNFITSPPPKIKDVAEPSKEKDISILIFEFNLFL